ncbi:MAG TPA: hypothetical protein VK422_00890 [Pyrinomonadaceae bacterium]|nr:hypothetical protein [Pyrinomonadaceae bacterium]
MADQEKTDAPDRFAHGTGRTEFKEAERDGMRPGETAGGQGAVLPETGRAEDSGADRAEGTVGAVGEMDFTGAPAGPGGSSGPSGGSAAGETRGGGPGGGSASSGGAGAGTTGAGPQSVESTTAALDDREPATSSDAGGAGTSRTES